MSRSSQKKYTDKPIRQAENIEKNYNKLGLPNKVEEKSSWTTVINEEFEGLRRVLDSKRRFGYRGL